jgi:gliding motility-associated-like protein
MIFRKQLHILLALAITAANAINSAAQLYAPGRNWAAKTAYTLTQQQDSIFVFFSTKAAPKKGTLRARHSDGSASTFKWYKYNKSVLNPSNRFQLFLTEENLTESTVTGLDRGGYQVQITNAADSTETRTAWVFIDDAEINRFETDNNCDFLWISAVVGEPTQYEFPIINEYFVYRDLSSRNHPEINKYGSEYFKNITWKSSSSQVTMPGISSLSIFVEDPAPLYDATYTIEINNPFGRKLTASTTQFEALATLADFKVFTDAKGSWTEKLSGEAPLGLKLQTKSVNADSVYWRIINDRDNFKMGGDSIIFRDSSVFTASAEVVLDREHKERMIPGTYTVEHIAVNVVSGCRDTMTLTVEVDSSLIKPDAIPNVFTPNGDDANPRFVLNNIDDNVKSIRYFTVTILSRWGQKVYSYTGDPKTWEGWDGKINNTEREAQEGVYYYIIDAVGWDGKRFKGGSYKGFVYLYRGSR